MGMEPERPAEVIQVGKREKGGIPCKGTVWDAWWSQEWGTDLKYKQLSQCSSSTVRKGMRGEQRAWTQSSKPWGVSHDIEDAQDTQALWQQEGGYFESGRRW